MLASATLICTFVTGVAAAPQEHRGIWLHPKEFATRDVCDGYVARMAAAGINVAYPLVWYQGGQAWWRTESCPMAADVTDDYDPLGYLVERCHAAGIQVHAWFVNGSVGRAKPVGALADREDWLLQPSRGQTTGWWDLGNPEVRDFQTKLMVEVLREYDADGVHFDYIRYNGRVLCFCDHCMREFRERTGHDLSVLSGDAFPLCHSMSSNPVGKPTTAKVLVRVQDGPPVIAVNELGKGKVLLLNWHAYRNPPAAVNTVLRRFLDAAGAGADKPLLLFTPEATLAKYSPTMLSGTAEWLQGLGYQRKIIKEPELDSLAPDAVVFLVAAYYTSEEIAAKLVGFVEQGGHVVVLDGPVYSMKEPSLQKLTGFAGTEGYYNGFRTLVVEQESDLVPTGGTALSEEEMTRVAEEWAQYRKDGVSALVRSVFEQARAVKPRAAVTAAVFQSVEAAESVYQDWPRWLREGIIDYVLPMAYVMENERLEELITQWKGLDPEMARIIPGLSIYQRDGGQVNSRPPDLVLSQVDLCRQAGAKGVNFFALAYLSEDLIGALAGGPFAERAEPYVPLVPAQGG